MSDAWATELRTHADARTALGVVQPLPVDLRGRKGERWIQGLGNLNTDRQRYIAYGAAYAGTVLWSAGRVGTDETL